MGVQSPPTESGIVVVSGSNDFTPGSSDFEVTKGLIFIDTPLISSELELVLGTNPATSHALTDNAAPSILLDDFTLLPTLELTLSNSLAPASDPSAVASLLFLGDLFNPNIIDLGAVGGFVPEHSLDVGVVSTPTTTSGIVIVNIFSGANDLIPYIPPILLSERIYPLLPQFSTITPGD